jgi:hypothetical protein
MAIVNTIVVVVCCWIVAVTVAACWRIAVADLFIDMTNPLYASKLICKENSNNK